MSKLATLTGHTHRVLYLAISPDGKTIVTGAEYETLRFWNVFPPCKSQVCNLVWSKNTNELVSTRGYPQNQILDYRKYTIVLFGLEIPNNVKDRVLYLAISPDGKTIVTGVEYETLRFWNVFPPCKSQTTPSIFGASSFGRTHIR
ncbi:Protein FIZZY-RELATED 2 [Artemisia annua]|uniref:Protein FIZZY-RELATED 2 n=1 Tax=Artemisia annua TaxID=35608 RepID=A0A2U1PX09_ARTAN|nr:Protein FIZZY-RELATED 2 [Artemisia annua]